MKKFALTAIAAAMFSASAVAADSHTRWEGSVEKFTGTITNKAQFDDLIKYTDYKTQANLKAAFADGKLTAQEIKDSGISDHHFYTGLLASAKSQAEYDKYLKQLNDGVNVDDNFVSNRDLKAAGSMIMNQVDAGNKIQDSRTDKIVAGLKDWASSFYPVNPDLPEDGQQLPDDNVDDSFGQNHVPDFGQGEALDPEVDNGFGQGHLPDFGNGEGTDPDAPDTDVDGDFGQGHVPDYGKPDVEVDPDFGQGEGMNPDLNDTPDTDVDDGFGQGHVPDYGRPDVDVDTGFGQGEAMDPDVDDSFGQGHLPEHGQGEPADPEVDENFGQGHLPDYGNGNGSNSGDIDRPFPGQGERPEAQPEVDGDFGQSHLPDYGNGTPAIPEIDNDFGVGHLPEFGQGETPDTDVDDNFGQSHLPDYGNGTPAIPEIDNGFGQGHVPEFGQGEAMDPEVDNGFGQDHTPDTAPDRPFPGTGEDRPHPQPDVDEDFGQGHVPDYGNGGDIDRPFPGQGDRPQPQPDVDEDFGQGHLPDNGHGNGNSGEVERPRPGNGEGSIERPRPGNGNGSIERPRPGDAPDDAGNVVVRPRPVDPTEGQVNRPNPGLGGAVANNGNNITTNAGNIQNNANNIESNKNNIAAMGDAFQDRVDNVNGWLTQVGTGITNNSDKIDTLTGAFQAQAAHNTKEIARLDGRIDALEEKTDKMKAGIAGAHAVASLTQYHGVGQHHVAVGIGSYDGEAAIAAGYTYAFDDKRTTIRGTFAIDTESEFAVGASIGHSW